MPLLQVSRDILCTLWRGSTREINKEKESRMSDEMEVLIDIDTFIDDSDEVTCEVMAIAELKVRLAIEKRAGLYHFNKLLDFINKQDELYNIGVVGLTKGKPESAFKEEELKQIWIDGRYCSYSCSETGLFYFHAGFGNYIQCDYSA